MAMKLPRKTNSCQRLFQDICVFFVNIDAKTERRSSDIPRSEKFWKTVTIYIRFIIILKNRAAAELQGEASSLPFLVILSVFVCYPLEDPFGVSAQLRERRKTAHLGAQIVPFIPSAVVPR